jgi:hypothetical protein
MRRSTSPSTVRLMPADGPARPSAASIAAALAILDKHADVACADELDKQTVAAGGERLLAAALANALYGAAIGTAMRAEASMVHAGNDLTEELSLARRQALGASNATGSELINVLRWQAEHIARPLRAWADVSRLGPLGAAAAAAASALALILDSFSIADPEDEHMGRLVDAIADAREELAAADTHLHHLQYDVTDVADEIADLIAAADADTWGIGTN